MSATVNAIVTPGDELGPVVKLLCGSGTYEHEGTVRASLMGRFVLEEQKDGKSIANVLSFFKQAKDLVINVNDSVIGRVTKINYNQAFVDIISVGDIVLAIKTKGIIRREDVRSTEVDKVVVHDFFGVGDIVRASVVSLGDSKQYYLSTAEKNLGVVRKQVVAN